jgi:hypothetical protein
MYDFNLISINTIVFVVSFFVIYTIYLAIQTSRERLDLYDFFLLSLIGLVPLFFVVFPKLTLAISKIIGVAYPFVVMFGVLFMVIFVTIHQLLARINFLESQNRLLVQELSILKFNIKAKYV